MQMRSTKTLSMTLPPDMLKRAQSIAKRESRTMSELIRGHCATTSADPGGTTSMKMGEQGRSGKAFARRMSTGSCTKFGAEKELSGSKCAL